MFERMHYCSNISLFYCALYIKDRLNNYNVIKRQFPFVLQGVNVEINSFRTAIFNNLIGTNILYLFKQFTMRSEYDEIIIKQYYLP